ncbi:NAD(P)H-hydrate dehydratase [Xanthomarina sp. F1114]|uniref:NAD(P)H-hydrate dehydratase n=1 Tax=Xanthomarina sp. F1114 TaxID=2996019 RepID=UPI00225E1D9F|nr:NAD(P)H-hydrate dehydratase [Xanthomarina sp. F1114]MCX7548014.1 NAD(P)H-hydrate dehydratase [Xanthomarina sp. F1114]
MKILSKEQIYEGDKLTAQRQGISSTELMERAGVQIFNWLHTRMQGAQVPIHVFCGIGNNGGDGLVVARHLITYGYNVHVYVVNCSKKRSKDFLNNYDRIKQVTKKWPILLNCKEDFPAIDANDIIIDAVFGIGLNREVGVWVKQLFQHFKTSKAFTLAIDIPSGLHTNQVPKDENGVVWANYTLSFQSPKLIFFLPDTAKYSIEWEVLDIGIDREFLIKIETEAELIGKDEVLSLYQPREKYSNKGDYGHALMVGGSYGKMGAVTLASRATLSSGAGLVTAYIPKCGYHALQSSFPEAMVLTDTEEKVLSKIELDFVPTVVGIGIGLGTDTKTIKALEDFLKTNKLPLVVDADAINILSKKKNLIKLLPEGTVLTPHPKELERLIGKWEDDFDKLKKVKAFTKKYNVIIVIKGANTITVLEDKLYVNTTGNPGLATGGTGDVLTGIITGLIAQGYNPLIASVFGVYLQGKSADIAVQHTGYQSLIASHVIETIGDAYLDLFSQPEPVEQEPKTKENSGKKRKEKK